MTGSLLADFLLALFLCVIGIAILVGWIQLDARDMLASIGNIFLDISGR